MFDSCVTPPTPTELTLNAECPTPGQDSNDLRLTGQVKDQHGQPMADVNVTLDLPNGEHPIVVTDSSGNYSYDFVGAKQYVGQDITAHAGNINKSLTITQSMFDSCVTPVASDYDVLFGCAEDLCGEVVVINYGPNPIGYKFEWSDEYITVAPDGQPHKIWRNSEVIYNVIEFDVEIRDLVTGEVETVHVKIGPCKEPVKEECSFGADGWIYILGGNDRFSVDPQFEGGIFSESTCQWQDLQITARLTVIGPDGQPAPSATIVAAYWIEGNGRQHLFTPDGPNKVWTSFTLGSVGSQILIGGEFVAGPGEYRILFEGWWWDPKLKDWRGFSPVSNSITIFADNGPATMAPLSTRFLGNDVTDAVMAGESPEEFALRHEMTVERLYELNPEKVAKQGYFQGRLVYHDGMRLRIQPGGQVVSNLDGARAMAASNSSATVVHVVQPGQTADQIANMYGKSWNSISSYNGLIHSETLPGQLIVIPTSGG